MRFPIREAELKYLHPNGPKAPLSCWTLASCREECKYLGSGRQQTNESDVNLVARKGVKHVGED